MGEDLAKFFYALTELNSEKKIPSHLAMSENPFTSEELHQRIRELCTAHSITARVALSKLVDDTKQSASDVAADATPTFTLNWRKVLGRYAGSRHQRRTVRTILGSPTPPEVRTLSVYTPGDDLRRVDWKASAKSDRLFVREFENFSPIESKSVGILIDWSDMGYYSETSGQIVNGEFIHKVVAFVRSMIADGKVPSVTLLSYGVPDLFIEGSEVRRLFGDATSPLLFNLTRMAARAAASAAMYGLNEQVARAAPTLAPEAEGQILAKCTGARRQMLLLVTNMPGGPLQSMSPSTPIWTDSFSYHLVKRGDAVRVEL